MLGLLGGVGLLCSLLGRRNGFFRKRGLGVEGGTGWEPEVSSECLGLNQLLFAPRVRLCALSWHQGEEEVEQVPAEILYQGLLPSLPQYMVSTAGPRGSAPSSWGCLTLRSPSAALSLSSHAYGFSSLPANTSLPPSSAGDGGLRLVSPVQFSVSPFPPDCSAEDPPCCSPHFQSQNGLHQHPGRRLAGGDAVSDRGGRAEAVSAARSGGGSWMEPGRVV